MAGILNILLGASGKRVDLQDRNITGSVFNVGETATAGYRFDNDGNTYSGTMVGGSYTYNFPEQWMFSGTVANYEVRATRVSGSTPTGTLTTWLVASTDRAWTVSASGGAVTSSELLIEVRDAVSLEVLDSCTVNLTASSIGLN